VKKEEWAMERNVHIAERSVTFALDIVRTFQELQQDPVGRILGRQLLRSGTSIGANHQEAQAAQSRADFVAKLSIAHKETRETIYWLRLLKESGIGPCEILRALTEEAVQLKKILSASLLTAKQNSPSPKTSSRQPLS
jgi:four helix bundle protein